MENFENVIYWEVSYYYEATTITSGMYHKH